MGQLNMGCGCIQTNLSELNWPYPGSPVTYGQEVLGEEWITL